MLGNGLQGSLLGIRANLEGFPTAVTGFVMSGYYLGFLIGSIVAPKILATVGHVRVFAALASLASSSALLHAVIPDPYIWTVFRIVTGFSFAGLYIVSESWLNDAATNETRGRILSFYMFIVYGAMAAGQFLLTVSDPMGYNLFVIISVLVSLALIPTALSASPAPSIETPKKLGIRRLFAISPLGVVGMTVVGVAQGAFFSMAAVYGSMIGLTLPQISLFICVSIIGGAVLQMPIGRLSDRFDRRKVLTVVTLLSAAAATLVLFVEGMDSKIPFMVVVTLFGGLSMPLYSLCIAHTNDHLEPDEMVAASSGLILMNGMGAVAGPFLISLLMASYGAMAFFSFLTVAHLFIGIFAIVRMSMSEPTPLEDQNDFVAMPVRSGPIAATMNPEAEEWDEEPDLEPEPNTWFTGLSKASMSILEDSGDDDDEEAMHGDLTDDGPALWGRNG
ncbi:MFS transporter [Sneathiella chinensis]|uniref:MFS transporter n=2 Tax=Sneathiella chinensis TaxID=349750 RepID=A0ABQ5U4C7_9PROT|nr:MFS transporter [Sneathiella chinensis]GLQ07022.1 MFS transporter [Sneathiella chinensis]